MSLGHKPLNPQSMAQRYESLDSHDGHDFVPDSGYMSPLLLTRYTIATEIRPVVQNNPQAEVLPSRNGIHRHHQVERFDRWTQRAD